MGPKVFGYLIVFALGSLAGGAAMTAYLSGAAPSLDPVVAEVAGEAVRASTAFKDNKRRLFELEDSLFRLKQQSVNDYIENRLLTEESKRTGLAVDKLIVQAVGTQTAPVTDAELDSFLKEKGIPLETPDRKEEVREYLRYRKSMEKRHAYLDTLKAQAKVKVHLQRPEAPRIQANTEGYPTWGKSSAPVTIVQFSDFQCPFTQRAQPVLAKVRAHYGPDKIRVVYRDLPNGAQERSLPTALAAHCAGDQGKFWEYHDALFENMMDHQDSHLTALASKLGLDGTTFGSCLDSRKHLGLVERSKSEGESLGIDSTPTFLINGTVVTGAPSFEVFKERIDAALSQNT